MIDAVISVFLLVGAAFVVVGSLGLARLPDFYTRLHSPTKATTLGMAGMLIASAAYFTRDSGSLSVHELLIAVFLFITAPVSAHLAAKAALHRQAQSIAPPPEDSGNNGGAEVNETKANREA